MVTFLRGRNDPEIIQSFQISRKYNLIWDRRNGVTLSGMPHEISDFREFPPGPCCRREILAKLLLVKCNIRQIEM